MKVNNDDRDAFRQFIQSDDFGKAAGKKYQKQLLSTDRTVIQEYDISPYTGDGAPESSLRLHVVKDDRLSKPLVILNTVGSNAIAMTPLGSVEVPSALTVVPLDADGVVDLISDLTDALEHMRELG